MFSGTYFELVVLAEADEADRRELERRELIFQRSRFDIDLISETHFIQRYRFSKEAFSFLCNTLRQETDIKSTQRVSLESKVLCSLLFYANGDYQRVVEVANFFSQEAISSYIEEVTNALNHPNILNKFIKFPSSPAARAQISQSFYNIYGIPGVIGCVDGSHFRIFTPKKTEEHLFYCRKHYHSLNVQMICDHKCRILSINAKFGGATHDSFVWENSRVNSHMQLFHQNREQVWLLGDSGYPQRPWLMTPYSNPRAGSAEETYNNIHSRAWVTIENTFGRLKNRWRCVCKDRVLHYKPEKCARIILACSVLHNICIDFEVPEPEDTIGYDVFTRTEEEANENMTILTLGRLMRDRLANRLHASRRRSDTA